MAYALAGLRLVGAEPRAYLTLLLTPAYIVWKLGVYLVAAAGLSDERWVRTARTTDAMGPETVLSDTSEPGTL